jgi:hypothetical protein
MPTQHRHLGSTSTTPDDCTPFAGYAALAAGDHAEAAAHLTQALDGLGPNGSKQRSVVLADLATAHGTDGDQAAEFLGRAIDALHSDWYGTGFDRVRAVRPVLGGSHHGVLLDQRITALAATNLSALPGR